MSVSTRPSAVWRNADLIVFEVLLDWHLHQGSCVCRKLFKRETFHSTRKKYQPVSTSLSTWINRFVPTLIECWMTSLPLTQSFGALFMKHAQTKPHIYENNIKPAPTPNNICSFGVLSTAMAHTHKHKTIHVATCLSVFRYVLHIFHNTVVQFDQCNHMFSVFRNLTLYFQSRNSDFSDAHRCAYYYV